jgi:hypothetical protein
MAASMRSPAAAQLPPKQLWRSIRMRATSLEFAGSREVDASERVLMRHIDVDVRVKRRLRAAARRVLRAVAPGAVGAEHRIHGGLNASSDRFLSKPIASV